jgi:hypothetical protein
LDRRGSPFIFQEFSLLADFVLALARERKELFDSSHEPPRIEHFAYAGAAIERGPSLVPIDLQQISDKVALPIDSPKRFETRRKAMHLQKLVEFFLW